MSDPTRFDPIRLRRVLAVLAACALLPACEATPSSNAKPDEDYVKAAWAYFKHKCDTEAGEKIYKTFTDVKSVLVVKPLPPATEKDLYDQFWMGDPYSASAHSQRGKYEAAILTSSSAPVSFGQKGRGFEFVESVVNEEKKEFVKYYYRPDDVRGEQIQQDIKQPNSRFAIYWEDISSLESRKFWVAGSRLRVIDLLDNSVVAERIGFLIEPGFGSTAGQRRPWQAARGIGQNGNSCPATHDWSDRWFVLRVLKPAEENKNGK